MVGHTAQPSVELPKRQEEKRREKEGIAKNNLQEGRGEKRHIHKNHVKNHDSRMSTREGEMRTHIKGGNTESKVKKYNLRVPSK